MGRPKQLLPWGKTTLLGHAVTRALHTEAKTVTVVLGAHGDRIKKEMTFNGVTVVHNPRWQSGLGSSIACGVKHLLAHHNDSKGILIMLADQPFIRVSYLNELIRCFREQPRQIIATSYGKRAGVPAIFGAFYFEALSRLQDDEGARSMIGKHAADVLALDPGPVADIDTPEAYRTLYHHHFNTPPPDKGQTE